MNKHFRGFEELLSVTSSRIHYSMAPPEMGALSLPSTLQTKSVHWKVVAFGPLVSGAIWVGKLVNWGYSVLNHSQLMCCGRSHSARALFPLVLHSYLSYKQLRLFKKIISLDFEVFYSDLCFFPENIISNIVAFWMFSVSVTRC